MTLKPEQFHLSSQMSLTWEHMVGHVSALSAPPSSNTLYNISRRQCPDRELLHMNSVRNIRVQRNSSWNVQENLSNFVLQWCIYTILIILKNAGGTRSNISQGRCRQKHLLSQQQLTLKAAVPFGYFGSLQTVNCSYSSTYKASGQRGDKASFKF